jgi:hypothetical protein
MPPADREDVTTVTAGAVPVYDSNEGCTERDATVEPPWRSGYDEARRRPRRLRTRAIQISGNGIDVI